MEGVERLQFPIMIDLAEYHNALAWLADRQRPLIVSHRKPDGDALGSAAALALSLGQRGQQPAAVLYEPFPQRYACLSDLVQWHRWDQDGDELAGVCDAVVILDTCSWSQLEPVADYLRDAPPTLVIDHHPTRDEIGTRLDDLLLIDESATATCVLVTELLEANNLPLTVPIASALFTGLATDCGWFRYANTDARALRVATALAEAGAPINATYRSVYEHDSPAKLRLVGRMLQGVEMCADNRLVVLRLRAEDFVATGADLSDTDDIVNEAGRIAGIESVILFVEQADGMIRVNFRSKSTLDVAALAQEFGGGGHKRAAGARIPGTWEDVTQRVTAAAVACLS